MRWWTFVFSLFASELFAADTLLYNANIITMESGVPRASAIALDNGNIKGIGDIDSLASFIEPETELIDLDGLTLLPGFIDSHVHVFEGASEIGSDCELDPALTLSQHITLLLQCATLVKRQGEWVTGYGFQLDAFLDGESDQQPLKTLDEIFPKQPVALMEESSHAVVVNSVALAILGFEQGGNAPAGGRIAINSKTGKPSGILFENAGDIAMEAAWKSQSQLAKRSYDGLLMGLQELASHGITTAGDGFMHWRKGWFEIWQKAQKNGELTARISVRPYVYPHVDISRQLAYFETIHSAGGGQLLTIDQVKIYIDGVLHFGSAKVAQPYEWSWQPETPSGYYYVEPKQLKSLLTQLHKRGYGAHIHAIGDQAISQAINAIEFARKKGAYRDYGLTHLEMLEQKDIPRLKRHDITADFQAGAAFFAYHDWAVPYIGKARAKRLLQMRKVFDSGANVTFSSDWTVNDLNPLVAIANSLRHKRGQGLPNIHEALKAATINGAKALGMDKVTGSIKVGKSADFVVLSDDITRLSPNNIEQVEVLMTWLQGEVVFDAEE